MLEKLRKLIFKKDSSEDKIMYVIAGLGNPDRRYENTRHNVGFDVIDALAAKYNISMSEKKHKAICGRGLVAGVRVLLVKPQTYMNLSGNSIADILYFYKLDPAQDLIVIFDDISLNPGNIRIREKGSAGGHNGIKSIIAKTGSSDFSRIKVGVGAKPEGWDLADHVLGHFSKEERNLVEDAIKDAVCAAEYMVQGETTRAMNEFNAKKRE